MSDTMMQAARLHELGGPEKLVVERAPMPEPGPGEVLVRVRAASLNHRDVFITQGLYRDVRLPAILGSDGAGEIADTGARVVINPMLDWGDDPHVWSERATIIGMPHPGTFAEYISVPAGNIAPMPEALSFEEAAALPLAGLTAYRATFTRGELQPGETVLITGIGGGVQTFALLFAKHIGARVIVTSSSDEKLERARALGADVTINYRTDAQWHKTACAAGPIDMVIDSAGGDTLAKAITAVRPGGRVVIYGGTTGDATLRPFSIFWHHIDIRGTSMGSPHDFHAMLQLFHSDLKPVIDRIFSLEEIVTAAQRMDAANQFGKIVITL
jgi:NADPH:quinone reductase-like Zn-dependent oxidoreductase